MNNSLLVLGTLLLINLAVVPAIIQGFARKAISKKQSAGERLEELLWNMLYVLLVIAVLLCTITLLLFMSLAVDQVLLTRPAT